MMTCIHSALSADDGQPARPGGHVWILLRTNYTHHYACMQPDPHTHPGQPHAYAWISQ